MTAKLSSAVRPLRIAALAALALLLAGCNNGQVVDAAGENGGGGLAFVLMVIFFWGFFGSLFYMDRVRRKREEARDRESSDRS